MSNLSSEELNTIIAGVADRKSRDRGIALLFTLFIIVFLFLLFKQSLAVQAQLKASVEQGQQQILQNQGNSKATLAAIQRRGDQLDANLQCIATLFAQNAPGTITITDFDNCKVEANAQAEQNTPSIQAVTSPAKVTPAPTPNPQPNVKKNLKNPSQNLKDILDNIFKNLGA